MPINYFNDSALKIARNSASEFGSKKSNNANPFLIIENNVELKQKGFCLFNIEADLNQLLYSKVTSFVKNKLVEFQEVPADFELEKYHIYLKDESTHFKVSSWAMDFQLIGNAYFEIKKKIESILQAELTIKKIEHMGNIGEFIGFRIIRPQKNDHNPLHRDSWIDFWQDTINVWLPICGFENGNSLQLIPQSHLWFDEEILRTKSGAEIDGKIYRVPAAIGTIQSFTIETPILKKGEGLVFSPFLIHGNGVNNSLDKTRISLEFRFCKK